MLHDVWSAIIFGPMHGLSFQAIAWQTSPSLLALREFRMCFCYSDLCLGVSLQIVVATWATPRSVQELVVWFI